MLSVDEKKKIIADFQISKTDVGSSGVQVAILTADINKLQSHFKANHKDHASRRGLMQKISRRKALLKYLKNTDEKLYLDVLQRLQLRK